MESYIERNKAAARENKQQITGFKSRGKGQTYNKKGLYGTEKSF